MNEILIPVLVEFKKKNWFDWIARQLLQASLASGLHILGTFWN